MTAPNLIWHGSRVSPDHFSSIASGLRPYLEERHYTLVIGHSLGAATVLSPFPHLPALYPTAIVLVDPSTQQGPEKLDFLDDMFTEFCVNIKPTEDHTAENPLWTREDTIYRELGTRLCSVDAVHGILRVSLSRWRRSNLNRLLPDSKTDSGTFSIPSTQYQTSGE